MNALQTHFWAVRDYLAPVLRESKFKEHGRITPEEFVAAGDFLSYKFPTWSWSAALSPDAKYTRDFLPADKQYLVSRGVPCLRRVSMMEQAAVGRSAQPSQPGKAGNDADERVLSFREGDDGRFVEGKGGEDDWLATHLDEADGGASSSHPMADIVDIPDSEPPVVPPPGLAPMTAGEEDELAARAAILGLRGGAGSAAEGTEEDDTIRDIPDMDDEEDMEAMGLGQGVEEVEDAAAATSAAKGTPRDPTSATESDRPSTSNLVSVRTYDCLITYDKYYQVPRMWLVGYDESGALLKPTQVFEDISRDYAQKTVTVEPFPHGNLSTPSIHPCKHASVMKKVIERMDAAVKREAASRAGGAGADGANAAAGDKDKKKKKGGWGIGGAVKRVAGVASGVTGVVGGGGAASTDPTGAGTGAGTEGGEVTTAAGKAHEGGGEADGNDALPLEGLRVDQYLLVFLKFMASIVPAIEIDATQAL